MVASSDDKRVLRTKRAVHEAMLSLIRDKPVSRVTTTELCREAGINRNTFYAHYSTPESLRDCPVGRNTLWIGWIGAR